MRFRLEDTDRAPYWLIGDPALNERTEDSKGLEEDIQITRNQQEVAGAGFDVKTFFDRQNQKVVFSADSYRIFTSEWERMNFLARLAPADPINDEHRWEGAVWLRLDGGSDYREWLLQDAVVSLAGTKITGEVGLRLAYRITAGGFAAGALSKRPFNLIGSRVVRTPPLVVINGAALDAAYADVWQGIQGRLTVDWYKGPVTFNIWPAGYYPGTPGNIGVPISAYFAQIAAELHAEDDTFLATVSGGNLSLNPTNYSDTNLDVTIDVMQNPGPAWNLAARIHFYDAEETGPTTFNLISGSTNNLIGTDIL